MAESSPSEYLKREYAATLQSVKDASNRIAALIHRTPVVTSSSLDSLCGRKLFFKCEVLQKGGSFKFRGACNAIMSLPDEVAKRGVMTHSSGNHAAAVALAAKLRGIPAHIVIPKNAPKCKIENVERYGGLITWCDPSLESREQEAAKVNTRTNATMIHPFNDGLVISGQGTIGMEFLEEISMLDVLIVPISGGGLISGIAVAAKAIKPQILVLAAEPMGADDAAKSKKCNYIVKNENLNTVADGLRASLGNLTWPIVRDLVDDIIVVDDHAIIQAMKLCYEILKIVVEPSGAIGLAAVLSKQFQSNTAWASHKHIGIVLSGGNIDLNQLWKSLTGTLT